MDSIFLSMKNKHKLWFIPFVVVATLIMTLIQLLLIPFSKKGG